MAVSPASALTRNAIDQRRAGHGANHHTSVQTNAAAISSEAIGRTVAAAEPADAKTATATRPMSNEHDPMSTCAPPSNPRRWKYLTLSR